MSKLNPDQWQAISAHLDLALEMTDGERSVWLSSLRTENPTLAHQIEGVIPASVRWRGRMYRSEYS